VVPAAEVYEAAVALVRPYVTGPTQALRAAKLAIDRGLDMDLESGRAWETQLFAGLFATRDAHDGMTAFAEKRKPTFTGG
jgi:enoyl-CoA hydratase/carnithine racemase